MEKREDILAYGETEDAERLLQILNSDRVRRRIIDKYDLWSHYEIERGEAGAQAAMAKVYAGKVDAALTRYGSIRIDVFDKSLSWPATSPTTSPTSPIRSPTNSGTTAPWRPSAMRSRASSSTRKASNAWRTDWPTCVAKGCTITPSRSRPQ